MIATTIVFQLHISAHATAGVPVVYAINPNHGPVQGGTSVTIYGSGFTGATQVKFGSTATSCGGSGGFFVVSDTQIFVTSPPGSVGTVDLLVVGPGGSSAAGAADKFTYATAALAVINGISPNHGSTAGGTFVTIDGTGFTNATRVMFGSSAAFANAFTDTTIEVVSPAGAVGTVDLTVINPAGTSAVTNTDKFTYTTPGAPAINAVFPNSATAGGGREVVIEGSGFINASGVKFGSTTLGPNQFSLPDDNHIFTSAPPGAAATVVDVTVTTPTGTSAVTNADKFSYLAATAPVVRGVTFNQGPSIGGTHVNLFGSGFSGVTAVNFGGTSASGVFAGNDNNLTATSPAGTVGTVHITVTTPLGTSSPGAADQFTYVTTPVPVIYGVAPSRGSTAGQTFVSIFGSGFTGTTSVHFGTNVATINGLSRGDGQISVNSPAAAAGTVDITVTTPGGTSAVSAADKFTYMAAGLPVVNSVTPNQGATGGGTFVQLFGSGFAGATAVHFGTIASPSVFAFTDTQLSAQSPPGTLGPVDITVTTPVGTSTLSAADRFTYITPATPAVTAVSPASGSASGGTTVWISGSGFSGVLSVQFGTAFVSFFQPVSDNVIEVNATPGGSVGQVDITVSTAGGTSPIVTADKFTYTAAPLPAVASVGPPSGPSTGGTTVYVRGTGLAGATAVNFGTNGSAFAPYSDNLITATSPAGAVGTVNITVVTPGGTSSITANDQYTYTASSPPPAPAVTVVSPASGSQSGGSTVWITGTNFTGATAVKFGLNLSNYFVSDDNLITVTGTPAGAVGVVDVTVVTPSGTNTTSASDHYTYVAAATPTVTGVSPATGPAGGGTTVWITGTGFSGASAVTFGTTGAGFGFSSDTLISATSPAGAGTIHITVTTSGGTSATSPSDQFVYGGPPPSGLQVNGVSPNKGAPSGGTSVEVFGMGFTGATALMFGSATAPTFSVAGDTLIFAISPAGTAGTVDVIVKAGGSSSAATNADHFTFAPPGTPVVNAIQPNHGSSAGQTSVTIFGSGFAGATSVQFGSSPPVSVFPFGDTQLNASSPPGTAGTSVHITVTGPAGTSATSLADLYTFVTPVVPEVDAVTPSSGSTLGGTSVTIFGSGLSSSTTVSFGTTPTFASFGIDTQIQVFTPPGTAGTVDVTVTTPGGTSATNNADRFTYVVPARPVVNAVSPNQGGTAGGRTVQLFGSGFSQATAVQFGTAAATNIAPFNDGQLDVTSPPGAVGTVHITVTAPGGVSAAGASDQYTYFVAPAPSITAVSPNSGAPGTQVFLTGTGFSDVTSVFFGSTCVPGFFSFGGSDTSLQVFAPSGPTGTVNVTVVSPDGTSTVSVNDQFTYTAPPLPTVTAVAPASGPSAGGTLVFVTGTGLSAVTGVTFGAAQARFFFAFDDGLIEANSPAGTNGTTVDVRVTSPGGTSAISSADQFTYGPTPLPTVTVLSPTSGFSAGGTEVFVTGSGFLNATLMNFGTTALSLCFFFGGGRTPTGGTPTARTPKPAILAPSQVPSVQVPIMTRVPVRTPTSGTIRTSQNSTPLYDTVLVHSVSYQLNTGLAPQPAFNQPSAPLAGGPPPCVSGFDVISDNLIDVIAPAQGTNTATVDLTVTDPGGTSAISAADQFTYVTTPAPVVSAVSPASGPSGGGTTVFISGKNLTNPSVVKFGGVAANITTDPFLFFCRGSIAGAICSFFTKTNDSMVEVISPPGTNSSTVDVNVTTAGGTSATSLADKFTYGPTPTPTVGAVGPSSGPVGTTVFVTGTGFLGVTAVDFGSVPAIPRRVGAQVPSAGGGLSGFFVVTDNLIQAISPLHAAGAVDVTVVSAGGTSATGTADKYTYTASPTPVVSIVLPNSGVAGTSVYITGTGLTGVSAVTFGTTAPKGFFLFSDALIVASAPGGSGTVDVTVTTPGGTSATSPADLYTLSGPPPPTVTSVAPNNGPGAGGTSVTITGTNLGGATAVTFGTTAATGVIVNSTTSVTATSPAGSGTVDVRVTTAGGISAISPGDKFTYTSPPPPPPTVTSVVPSGGPPAGGTSVTITGTNLTLATAVAFGATAATTFAVNSATQITATSPAGAANSTVDVTVTTAGGTSATNNADKFTYVLNSLQLSPTGIGFGGLPVGTVSGIQGLTVTNTGASNVQVSATMGTGNTDQFHVVDNACSAVLLVPTATCTAHFTFNPTTAGDKLARFTVTGASSGTLTLDLTGTGLVDACASTSITTDLTSPQSVGAHVTLMATSAGCPDANPLYRFYVRDTSATWHVVQDFSTANSYLWDTTTWGQGTFLIGVWVKDANSPNTYDAFAFGTFTLGLPTCSSTNMTSDVASPQAVGVTVNFTATSIGCPSPLYQWFVNTAGTWSIVPGHDFAHSSNTFAWNTTGLADGTYQVGVWAKQKNSTNSYDAFAFITYTLTINHCTAVNLVASPTSPQATGIAITLTPTVTGCASPQYRFYVRDAAGTWHIQQDFGVGATYVWNSSSTPVNTTAAGTFLLGVWAKQAGSTNTYDAFAFITFSLTSGPTCTVNIAANKTSPQPLGTSATWTATASGCNTTPLTYQFWVNPPGGTWGIVQPFAAANTYLWNGATAGTYQVGVWVKQSGSTASYDNFAFTTFTLTPASSSQVCSSVNVGAAPGSPQSVGTAIIFTATGVIGCASPQYRWWVRDTSATWNIVQDYPGTSTFNWSTGSLPAGTYLVGVWVRQTGSSASYEAYYFLTFTLTGSSAGQACSSVNIAPSVASPQAPGANITFTAAALGCGTPNYRFFIAPPSTGVFSEVQPFGAANTFLWHTAGLGPGPYQVGVWARQSGSTATYEAFAFITFQLQVPVCTALTLTTSPSQSNPTGTAMTFTASASGCPNPRYQFYVQSPGGSFVVVQAYSSSATLNWPTAAQPAGQYHVLVIARDATSPASFDSFAETDFTLT